MIPLLIILESLAGFLLISAIIHFYKKTSLIGRLRIIKIISAYILSSLILSIFLSISIGIFYQENEIKIASLINLILHLILIPYTWFSIMKKFL